MYRYTCKEFLAEFMKNKLKQICNSKSREVEQNLLKMEKDSFKNAQENLKLSMKKVAWCKSGTRTPGTGTSGPWDPGPGSPLQSLKVGPSS